MTGEKYLTALRRHWRLILGCAIVVGVATFGGLIVCTLATAAFSETHEKVAFGFSDALVFIDAASSFSDA